MEKPTPDDRIVLHERVVEKLCILSGWIVIVLGIIAPFQMEVSNNVAFLIWGISILSGILLIAFGRLLQSVKRIEAILRKKEETK